MLDLSGPAPAGHVLSDVWDLLQALAVDRAARRPPPGFPAFLWGAPPYIGAQPEPFFDGRPGEAFADLWASYAVEERVDAARRLMRLGVRTAQLVAVTREPERLFRGVQSSFRLRQRRGPVPTARQIFKLHATSSHANTLMDALRHRFSAHACRSVGQVVRNFEIAFQEYRDVVTVDAAKLDGAEAWAVLWALLEQQIELRVCREVVQLYWMLREHGTTCSPFIVSPELGVTAADRVRFYLQYAVVPAPR
jgi:hypothetical protein